MPYINVRITDDNVTKEQKLAIVQGCTQLMVDILNKDPQKTFVVIDEVPKENWGIGHQLVG
jgi:4-oxalocrotonate tautomerase